MIKKLLIAVCLVAVCFSATAQRQQRRELMPKSSATTYSPADTANLFAWYKPDALVTNTSGTSPASGGDQVAYWGDSSGNGRHLRTNSASVAAPVFRAAATTGKTYGGLEHQAVGACFQVGFTAQADTTIFVVWRSANTGSDKTVFDSTNAAARQTLFKSSSEFVTIYSGSAAVTANGVAIANPSWNIATAVFNSAGNDSLYTNSVAFTTTGSAGSQSLDGLSVLASNSNGNPLTTGEYVGEVIVYSRLLNSTEIGQVNTYLNSRWSIY